MNTTTAIQAPSQRESVLLAPMPTLKRNPWTSDPVLLNLSVWWVQMTHPGARRTSFARSPSTALS